MSYQYQPVTGQPPAYPPQQPQQPPPRRRQRPRWRGACLGCGLALLSGFVLTTCVVVVIGAIVWNNFYQQIDQNWNAKLKELQQQTFQTTHIYDRNGNELHQIFDQGRRTNIKLTDVPQTVIDATIAVEDSTFYDNPGVDFGAIARAGVQYFQSSDTSSGASTITQQLVRNIAFDYAYRIQRSPQRKFEEIVMALALTQERSKNDILEMYLNQIYYGNLAYGIEAASQTYFGKSAKSLDLAESALLAGLPQAPAELDPLSADPNVQAEVQARRKVVLDLMVDKGKISRDQASTALAEKLTYADPNVNLKSPHFTLYAEQELKS